MGSASVSHSFHVHLQTIIWELLHTTLIEPLEWGWNENADGTFSPIKSDKEAARENLLSSSSVNVICQRQIHVGTTLAHVEETVWNVYQLVEIVKEKGVIIVLK